MDFSDVNEVVSSPGEPPVVPPEPPTPPDFTRRENSPAPVLMITKAPAQLLNVVEAPAARYQAPPEPQYGAPPEPQYEAPPEPVVEAWVAPAQAEHATQVPSAAVDYSQVQGILASHPGLVPS